MPLIPVKPVAQIKRGAMFEFEASGGVYAICNVEGTFHCIDGICPHADGPLAQGALHGATIVCPWHGWEFDVRTGACAADESCKLATYPVVIKQVKSSWNCRNKVAGTTRS